MQNELDAKYGDYYLTFFNLPHPAATATATASRLRSQKLHIVLWGLHVGLVL